MEDFVGYIFVILTASIFAYALIWQIREMREVRRSTNWKTPVDKRKLAGNYFMTASLAVFFVSYILNITVGTLAFMKTDYVQNSLINSNTTAFACFISLAIYFISRFGIVPKEEQEQRLLKLKV